MLRGKFKKVEFAEDLEENCKIAYFVKRGWKVNSLRLPEQGSYEEAIIWDFGYEFFICADRLYQIIEREELYDGDSYCKITPEKESIYSREMVEFSFDAHIGHPDDSLSDLLYQQITSYLMKFNK